MDDVLERLECGSSSHQRFVSFREMDFCVPLGRSGFGCIFPFSGCLTPNGVLIHVLSVGWVIAVRFWLALVRTVTPFLSLSISWDRVI